MSEMNKSEPINRSPKNKNTYEYAQTVREREDAEKQKKERGPSARDRLLTKLRDARSTENAANSRYA